MRRLVRVRGIAQYMAVVRGEVVPVRAVSPGRAAVPTGLVSSPRAQVVASSPRTDARVIHPISHAIPTPLGVTSRFSRPL